MRSWRKVAISVDETQQVPCKRFVRRTSDINKTPVFFKFMFHSMLTLELTRTYCMSWNKQNALTPWYYRDYVNPGGAC